LRSTHVAIQDKVIYGCVCCKVYRIIPGNVILEI